MTDQPKSETGDAYERAATAVCKLVREKKPLEIPWMLKEHFPPQPDESELRQLCELYVASNINEEPADGLSPYCLDCNSSGGGHHPECLTRRMQIALAASGAAEPETPK